MPSNRSFSDLLLRLGQLSAGLEARAGELDFLAEDHAALKALLDEARSLDEQQEALKARTQQVTAQLAAKQAKLEALESRIRAMLKGKYGAKSEALESFGVKPARSPVRKKAG
ncbi:MAG: hypothetical protein ACOYYI_07615 [Chloroflexota bacterium]